jgi:hypothetical protein
LKERERDDRDDEIARLKSKVGEITMDNELLYAKIAALEGKRPADGRYLPIIFPGRGLERPRWVRCPRLRWFPRRSPADWEKAAQETSRAASGCNRAAASWPCGQSHLRRAAKQYHLC